MHSILCQWMTSKEEEQTTLLFDDFRAIINNSSRYDERIVNVTKLIIRDGKFNLTVVKKQN